MFDEASYREAKVSRFVGQDRRSAPQCLADCRPLINLKTIGNLERASNQYRGLTYLLTYSMEQSPS